MSLLRRLPNALPRLGEYVRIYEMQRLLAEGTVILMDGQIVTIAGKSLVDLDLGELRRGLHAGRIRIERTAP